MKRLNIAFSITHPKGYELDPKITGDTPIEHHQDTALKGAEIVYVKNWSSFKDYGKVMVEDPSWTITSEKIGNAQCMHCLPVRRNVVIADNVLDSDKSLVLEQANNRTYAAQWVLRELLKTMP